MEGEHVAAHMVHISRPLELLLVVEQLFRGMLENSLERILRHNIDALAVRL